MSKINAVELYTENGITLYDVDGVVMTTTESIALKFGKRKDNVDRNLKGFPDYEEMKGLLKIEESQKIGVSKSDMKSIDTYIDRDVMTLLIMGFTGDKAYQWKKQYIEAFNLMEKKILEKKQSLPALPQTYIEALEALVVTEKEKQLALAKIERDKPKVEFSERIETAVNSINIGSYAKSISKEHGINVGQNKLFAWMRDNDILIKLGRRKNFPTSKYMEKSYFEVKTSSVATGNGIREVHTTLITGKGQVGLVNKIIDHFNKNN